jgi:hypothetical protein
MSKFLKQLSDLKWGGRDMREERGGAKQHSRFKIRGRNLLNSK